MCVHVFLVMDVPECVFSEFVCVFVGQSYEIQFSASSTSTALYQVRLKERIDPFLNYNYLSD